MKLMKRLAALKKQTGIKAGAPEPSSTPSGPLPWRRRAILGCCLLLAGVGTWALFEFVIWNTLPSELVGKWDVTEGPNEYAEASFRFYRSGYTEGYVNVNGDLKIIKSNVRVQGKNIVVTSWHPKTGEETVQVQKIRKLTDTELVVEDERGNLLKMRRAE